MDALDAALDAVRVKGSMVGRSMVTPPWALSMETAEPRVLAAVLRGSAWVRHGGAAPVHLDRGAVVVGRGGAPLVLGDRVDTSPQVHITDRETCWDLTSGESVADRDRTGARTWGPADAPVAVVLGAYRADGALYALLDMDLPALIVVQPDPTVAAVLAAVAAETQVERPGQQVVVDRLMELLLLSAIRAWLASPGGAPPTWSTALADPVVGAALRAMHADPRRRWTVATLAHDAGSSRTAFADRFRALVGEPPIVHLARWRMALAADLLRTDLSLGLTAVAARVGYADAFSFSTAFRRVRGTSPTEHRRSCSAGT